MAIKEYALNTTYGITTVELTTEEHEALATKAKLKEEQRAIFANAAMILELLDEDEPQAASTIAELAGIDAEKSASWKRAFAALTKAGLVRRHGYGPKTRYTRVELEAAAQAPVELSAPKPWLKHPHHALFYGMTGSGKSNALYRVIGEVAPEVKIGKGKLYGIDLKGSELAIYEGSSIFEKISVGIDDEAMENHIATIAEVSAELKTRLAKNRTIRLASPADLNRYFVASAEEPLVVLVIDELDVLVESFRHLGKPGASARSDFEQILAMGRSLGVYVVAATQKISLGGLGSVLDNFGRVDVFHQSSRYFNDRLLGEGAAEKGYDSTSIELASPANGYRSAGIAFERSGDEIRKVCFRHISDEDIAALVRRFQKDADGEAAQ